MCNFSFTLIIFVNSAFHREEEKAFFNQKHISTASSTEEFSAWWCLHTTVCSHLSCFRLPLCIQTTSLFWSSTSASIPQIIGPWNLFLIIWMKDCCLIWKKGWTECCRVYINIYVSFWACDVLRGWQCLLGTLWGCMSSYPSVWPGILAIWALWAVSWNVNRGVLFGFHVVVFLLLLLLFLCVCSFRRLLRYVQKTIFWRIIGSKNMWHKAV